MEPDGLLLICCQRQSVCQAGHAARHQPAVVAPGEGDPRAGLLELIMQVSGLFQSLIVVDAKCARVDR